MNEGILGFNKVWILDDLYKLWATEYAPELEDYDWTKGANSKALRILVIQTET